MRKLEMVAMVVCLVIGLAVGFSAGFMVKKEKVRYVEADYPNDLAVTMVLTNVTRPEVVESDTNGTQPVSCVVEVPHNPSHADMAAAYDLCVDELHRQAEMR